MISRKGRVAARKAALHFSLSSELIPSSDTPNRVVSSEETVAPEQEAPAFAMAVSIVDLIEAGVHDSAVKDALKLVAAKQEARCCAETSKGEVMRDRKRNSPCCYNCITIVLAQSIPRHL